MGKNKRRLDLLYSHEFSSEDLKNAIFKYNKNPKDTFIYYDKKEGIIIARDLSYEKKPLLSGEGRYILAIGGNKNKKVKIKKSDIVSAVNNELAFDQYLEEY